MLIAISGLTTEEGWLNCLSRKRGSAGAGKDEAAKQLVVKHGFVPMSFADPLKRILQDVFDFTDDQLWGPSENRNKGDSRYPRTYHGSRLVDTLPDGSTVQACLTPRLALQTLGDGWGRNECYENIWAEYATRAANKIASGKYGYDQKRGLYEYGAPFLPKRIGEPPTNVVITDLRYQNEAEAVRQAGGKLVRIKRKVKKLKVAPTHKSENDLLGLHDDDFDWVLNNKSTLEDLWGQVDSMMNELTSHVTFRLG
jgi:hypothetical protein